MSRSFFVNQYIQSNLEDNTPKVFYVEAKVSYLDVLNHNKVKLVTKDYIDCKCKDSNHMHDYFVTCDKCNGKGEYSINGHIVTCNKCKGERLVRIHDCYLCNNEGKRLDYNTLEVTIDNDKEVIYHGNGYDLVISLDIYDKDSYHIEGHDIYYLDGVYYSKGDYKNKVSKKIKTCKDESLVQSKFTTKKEVVCLEGKGIENGNFYFAFINELEEEKKEEKLNVIISESGYIDLSKIVDNTTLATPSASIDQDVYFIDESIDKIETSDRIYLLNKLSSKEFYFEDNKLTFICKLDKEDMDNDKKVIFVNNEKINLNYRKNLKEPQYVEVASKLFKTLQIKVVPYFEHEYKICIKKNKDVVYIDDYKHIDYRFVETFKQADFLDNPIKVGNEDKIVIGNDIVYIERV